MRKKKISVLIVFLIVISCIGVSYAVFTYYSSTNVGSLVASNVYMYTDSNTNARAIDMLPMDRATAIRRSNTRTSFLVNGRNDTDKTLTYTIDIVNRKVDGKENIPFRFVNIDIFDNNETYYVQDVSIADFKEGDLPTFTITPNTDYFKRFYVRFWVNKDIFLSDSDPRANFKLTESGSAALPLYRDAVVSFDVVVSGTLN